MACHVSCFERLPSGCIISCGAGATELKSETSFSISMTFIGTHTGNDLQQCIEKWTLYPPLHIPQISC
jgi:hypothetical protein